MTASRLYKVAQVLGVDVGFFFEGLHGAEESPSGAMPQQRLLLELAKNFMTLSPEHQQAICTVVRMLSEPAASSTRQLSVCSPARSGEARHQKAELRTLLDRLMPCKQGMVAPALIEAFLWRWLSRRSGTVPALSRETRIVSSPASTPGLRGSLCQRKSPSKACSRRHTPF